jgi:hypothetical protein
MFAGGRIYSPPIVCTHFRQQLRTLLFRRQPDTHDLRDL